MKLRKITKIFINQTKRFVILPETEKIIACPECVGDEMMVAVETAASVFGFPRREVYQIIEAGNVHFLETKEGVLFVCQKSLENNLL